MWDGPFGADTSVSLSIGVRTVDKPLGAEEGLCHPVVGLVEWRVDGDVGRGVLCLPLALDVLHDINDDVAGRELDVSLVREREARPTRGASRRRYALLFGYIDDNDCGILDAREL